MAGKGSGYFGHSREHGLHRKGIPTKTAQGMPTGQIQRTKNDESSEIWFQSNGVLGDMVSLANLVGFDNLLGKNKASGVKKKDYEKDAKKIIVFPSEKTKKSVEWLKEEYKTGDRVRKKQIKRMVDITIKEIESKLGKQDHIDVRINLHKSREMLVKLQKELN